jgi:hypothetical protein
LLTKAEKRAIVHPLPAGTPNHQPTKPMTPKTDSILIGIKQLPTISESTANDIVRKLRIAEVALQKAEEQYTQALRDIADDITEDGDGWTFDEIWKTDLRGTTEIIRHLRAKGLDA